MQTYRKENAVTIEESQTPPHEKSVRRAKKVTRIKKHKKTDLEKIGRGINYEGRRKKKPGRKVRLTPEEKREAHERQEQALQLRMTGITYKEIANALGYANPSSAKAAVDAAIWRTEKEAATQVVALDLARLDEFQMRCMHALRNNGDLHQIDRLMRIMEMRYRLLGISDETVRAMQQDHGIVINQKNMVMNVHAAPETENEFIEKMMRAVGVDPNSPGAKKLLDAHDVPRTLPMLEGSANNANGTNRTVKFAGENRTVDSHSDDEDDIVEAEIVEEI